MCSTNMFNQKQFKNKIKCFSTDSTAFISKAMFVVKKHGKSEICEADPAGE